MTPTKDRIVEATADLFQQFGYCGTGLKQVGTRAGAPSGSIYHHFPGGKEELAEHVIRQSGRFYLELVLAALRAPADPVSAVRGAFSGAAEVLVATDYRDACPVATVALEVASSNERLRTATAIVFEEWTTTLAEYLTTSGVPAAATIPLATVFIELLEGAFLLSRANRDTAPMFAAGDAAALLVSAALTANNPAGTP